MFRKKKPEPEEIDSDIDFDFDTDADIDEELSNLDDELSDIDKELKDLDKKSAGAIENLDVEGYWNKRFRKGDDFLDNGGLMATVYGEAEEKDIQETITRAEQDIIDLKLSMVNVDEGIKVGRELINQFESLKMTLGIDVYARLILGLRHSCTKEVQIGFHEPSFSEWDIDEKWVDEEYKRRLQGIDVASADWKKGVAK
ncbi:MAG: hypothetical protein ACXABY_07935 [Candidatus Thorarchaeota archaeon]|jgi:hypothetical protein